MKNTGIFSWLLASTIFLTIYHSNVFAMNAQKDVSYSTLEFLKKGKSVKVALPFPYKHIDKEQAQNTLWLPQGFGAVLDAQTKHSHIVLAPLMPCVAVLLHNQENGKIIAFHKSYAESIDHALSIAKEKLRITEDSSKIRGLVFTFHDDTFETTKQNLSFSTPKTFKELHENKSQLEELKFIKDAIVNALDIKDRNQIKAQKFTNEGNFSVSRYPTANVSIVVDRDFAISSVCMIHEQILGDINIDNPMIGALRFIELRDQRMRQLRETYDPHFLKNYSEKNYSYNSNNFVMID